MFIVIPKMSDSFTWTPTEVAKLGTRGTIYILAQENLKLTDKVNMICTIKYVLLYRDMDWSLGESLSRCILIILHVPSIQ